MGGAEPFLNTNVLLYLLSADAAKADRAEELLTARGVISVQVLNEFASVASRKLDMTWPEIREILAAFRTCRVEAGDRGAAMATPVVADDAIAVRQEEQHLVVPVVGRQGPAMMEHDRLGVLGTPVLKKDLRAVIGGDVAGSIFCSSFWTVSCILRGAVRVSAGMAASSAIPATSSRRLSSNDEVSAFRSISAASSGLVSRPEPSW